MNRPHDGTLADANGEIIRLRPVLSPRESGRRLVALGRPPLGDRADLDRWNEEFLAVLRAAADDGAATRLGEPGGGGHAH